VFVQEKARNGSGQCEVDQTLNNRISGEIVEEMEVGGVGQQCPFMNPTHIDFVEIITPVS